MEFRLKFTARYYHRNLVCIEERVEISHFYFLSFFYKMRVRQDCIYGPVQLSGSGLLGLLGILLQRSSRACTQLYSDP